MISYLKLFIRVVIPTIIVQLQKTLLLKKFLAFRFVKLSIEDDIEVKETISFEIADRSTDIYMVSIIREHTSVFHKTQKGKYHKQSFLAALTTEPFQLKELSADRTVYFMPEKLQVIFEGHAYKEATTLLTERLRQQEMDNENYSLN